MCIANEVSRNCESPSRDLAPSYRQEGELKIMHQASHAGTGSVGMLIDSCGMATLKIVLNTILL